MQKLIVIFTGILMFSTPVFSFSRWDDLNKPTIFESDYEYNLKNLTKSGFLSVIPWSDNYYPTEKGGISYRWNMKKPSSEVELYGYPLLNMNDLSKINIAELSPAEKWDIYMGDKSWGLTNYERKRTKIMRTVPGSNSYDANFKIPSWEGLCHSWAPATLLFENPEAVTVVSPNGVKVSFGASDIKALLTMFMDTNKTESKFLGSRCDLNKKELKEKLAKGEITAEEYADAMVELSGAQCDGVNPGAFHIVLTNQINRRDEGFVVDVTRDAEVWNQPVIGFESKFGRPEQGSSPGSAEGTIFQIYVKTKMYYIAEIPMSWTSEFKRESVNVKYYEYILELDKDYKILGGKWISEERPDFMWKMDRPKFNGYFKPLEKIYKKSTEHVRRLRFIRAANHLGNLQGRADAARARIRGIRAEDRFHSTAITNLRVSRFLENLKRERLRTKFQTAAHRSTIITSFLKLPTLRKERDEALVKAVREKNNDKIIELVNLGADVNGKRFNFPSEYLLNEIIYPGNLSMVQLFIKKGATLETPLLKAIEIMDMEIIELLISSGAKTDVRTLQGETLLMVAAKNNYLKMAEKLLTVDQNSLKLKDKLGRNTLIVAIIGQGNPPDLNTFEMVKLLVEKGINIEARDSFGKDAMDYVKSIRRSPNNAHKKIKSYLEKTLRDQRRSRR